MNAATDTVIRWARSTRLLSIRLSEIAHEELHYRIDELPCTVVDILDPKRNRRWTQFLTATGASPDHADEVWNQLSGGDPERWQWMYDIDWIRVRAALLTVPPLTWD